MIKKRKNLKYVTDLINKSKFEYLYSDNIIIIEWGNLVRDLLPNNMISIFFEHFEFNRRKIFSDYESFSN